MSSVGQALGGIVGAAIGFFTPLGPLYGAQIGMTLGGMLDPPKTQGPRLQDLTAQTSIYGAFIPRVYGTVAMSGNIFWIQNDKLIEHEVDSGGKGGPTVTNFEYSASFAVGLCEGPITGIRRIWIGGQLWYDSGTDDFDSVVVSNEKDDTFTVYLGTETQEADPLIQADRGVADVPAYTGLAYIVFNELPLKDYGNSLAGTQVKVEVVKDGTISAPTLVKTIESVANGELLPVAQYIDAATASCAFSDPTWDAYYADDQALEYLSLVAGDVFHTKSRIISKTQVPLLNQSPYGFGALIYLDTNTYQMWSDKDTDTYYKFTGTIKKRAWFNKDSTFYAIANIRYIEDQYTQRITKFSPVAFDGLNNESIVARSQIFASYSDGNSVLFVDGDGNVVFIVTGHTYILDPDNLELLEDRTNTITFNSHSAVSVDQDGTVYLAHYTDGRDLWKLNSNMTAVDTVFSVSSLTDGLAASCVISVRNNLYFRAGPTTAGNILVEFWNLYPFSTNLTNLGDIVEAECLQSELLTATDLDVTDLTDEVRGYRISSLAPIRGGIDPLRRAWPFDAVQHGYKIKFKARGGASVATITEAELDARSAGSDPGVRVSNSREMDTVIPDQLTVKYLDAVREYDINVAEETR